MVAKAKILYFTVFTLVVFAFVFHITAMGHHRWKKANTKNITTSINSVLNNYTIGLFTRCIPTEGEDAVTCLPNRHPSNASCYGLSQCNSRSESEFCQCDYLPSTKGIAACTIIAAVFLGIAIIILFIQSINTSETRSMGIILGFFPLLLLLLAFIFILIALILVGSYLSRDIMHLVRPINDDNLGTLRQRASDLYEIRVDWATGLEIIALILTFFSLILYSVFVFKLGRSS